MPIKLESFIYHLVFFETSVLSISMKNNSIKIGRYLWHTLYYYLYIFLLKTETNKFDFNHIVIRINKIQVILKLCQICFITTILLDWQTESLLESDYMPIILPLHGSPIQGERSHVTFYLCCCLLIFFPSTGKANMESENGMFLTVGRSQNRVTSHPSLLYEYKADGTWG